MKFATSRTVGLFFAAIAAASVCTPAEAQMTYTNNDFQAMLCFRKPGGGNSYDLEVNIGAITNLVALSAGSSTNFGGFYTASQLTTSMGSANYTGVAFSVTASYSSGTAPSGYPIAPRTVWATVARPSPSTQTTPYARFSSSSLTTPANYISAIGVDAANYAANSGSSSPVDTSVAIAIASSATGATCDQYMGAGGNVGGYVPGVENTAPAPFSSALVSDLYESVPVGKADPLNGGATTGNVSYVGYFTFGTDGSLTFTRAGGTPPPQPQLSIVRAGNTSTISFTATNTATYGLIFTNLAGLTSPRSTWLSVGTPFTGFSGATNFTDTTTDAGRVYSVTAH